MSYRYQPIEPVHQSFTQEPDNQQELNELSTESPMQIPEDHLMYKSRNMLDDETSKSFIQNIKGCILKLRLLQFAPNSMPTICVVVMVSIIFILCSLGPSLIKVRRQTLTFLPPNQIIQLKCLFFISPNRPRKITLLG